MTEHIAPTPSNQPKEAQQIDLESEEEKEVLLTMEDVAMEIFLLLNNITCPSSSSPSENDKEELSHTNKELALAAGMLSSLIARIYITSCSCSMLILHSGPHKEGH